MTSPLLSISPWTMSDDIPQQEQDFFVLTFIINFFTQYFWMLTCSLGIPGNILSFMISLSKNNRKFSTCIYMAGLAIVDTILLIATAVVHTAMFWLDGISEFQFQWGYYWANVTAILSGLFLTMMSVDRLIVVRFPLAAKQTCTTSRAKKAVVISVVPVMGINCSVFFVFKSEGNSPYLKVTIPGYPALETVVNMYYLVCGTILPFFIIVLCNLWIILTITNASKKRAGMGVANEVAEAQGKETRHLTRMLIFVCAAYIVTSVPLRLHDLVITSIPALQRIYFSGSTYWLLRYTTQYSVVLGLWNWNYAINFYLYCVGGGKRYRADVKRLFNCK